MKAGREIDTLVAEKVMGLKPVGAFVSGRRLKPYSTDISAAWEVVEKMEADKWALDLLCEHGFYGAHFYGAGHNVDPMKSGGWDNFDDEVNSAAHAICLAALMAISDKSKDDDL